MLYSAAQVDAYYFGLLSFLPRIPTYIERYFVPVCRIDGMVKVRNLKKHMERFNEVVNGLKEGKQEMSKQVQELAAAVDALLAKIKVSERLRSEPAASRAQKIKGFSSCFSVLFYLYIFVLHYMPNCSQLLSQLILEFLSEASNYHQKCSFKTLILIYR